MGTAPLLQPRPAPCPLPGELSPELGDQRVAFLSLHFLSHRIVRRGNSGESHAPPATPINHLTTHPLAGRVINYELVTGGVVLVYIH